MARPYWQKPCAAAALISYRYRGQFGFVMIGAVSDVDAMVEARRSLEVEPDPAKLEVWNGAEYRPVTPAAR